MNVAIHAQQSGAALQIFAGVREMDGMAGLGRVDRDKTVDFTAEMLRAGVFTLPRGLMYLSGHPYRAGHRRDENRHRDGHDALCRAPCSHGTLTSFSCR